MIQAIQTLYKGYRFRSRLEARWAVFFDSLAIAYTYEPEGYELPSGRYLPDFWLPSLGCWVEIKPEMPTVEERQLCEELAEGLGKAIVIAVGVPGSESLSVFCCDVTDSSGGCAWWESAYWALTKENRICICSGNDRGDRDFMLLDFSAIWKTMQLISNCKREKFVIERAYRLARSARFEHGETPK